MGLQQNYMRGAGAGTNLRQPNVMAQAGFAQGYPAYNQMGNIPGYPGFAAPMTMPNQGNKFMQPNAMNRAGFGGMPRQPNMNQRMPHMRQMQGMQMRMSQPMGAYSNMGVRPGMQQMQINPMMNMNNMGGVRPPFNNNMNGMNGMQQ